MLPPNPEVLVSAATALATWEDERNPPDAELDRAIADARYGDASLRFVHFVGFWSHFASDSHCSSWPLPPFERISELADFAAQHRAQWLTPAAGDVFLLGGSGGSKHVGAGIVRSVENTTMMMDGSPEFICTTIEGALGSEARPRLGAARLVRRRLSPALGDSFVRWRGLPAAGSSVDVEYVLPKDVLNLAQALRASHRAEAV